MNRRDFLKTTGLLLVSGKVLGDMCVKEYKNHIIDKIHKLPKHIHVAETEGIVNGVAPTKKKGSGIVVDGHYITQHHITDTKSFPTPFGMMEYEIEDAETRLYDKKLEKVFSSPETDISVYKLPTDLSIPDFPCEPGEVERGENIYLISYPHLSDFIIRGTKIIDTDGHRIYSEDKELDNDAFFGFDTPVIPGDSGTPIVGEDYKLLGLSSYRVSGAIGYGVKIDKYLEQMGD